MTDPAPTPDQERAGAASKYRLKLTTERWVDWYSESRVLTERYDAERNEWMVF